MCGIVAYSGPNKNLLNVLLAGLKRLEYRGYDSAGVAVVSGDSIYSEKAVGKIENLEKAISKKPPKNVGTIGIAHTRWATHGEANYQNAHPHTDQHGKIWLAHNGIIENYQEIKDHLRSQGVKFKTETDTEAIAQLIGFLYKGDLKEAVLEATKHLVGAYSLVIISKDEPTRLIGVRLASPLVLGILPDEFIIASDVSAIIEKTKTVVYLEDGELVDINGDHYEVVDFKNQIKKKAVSSVDWDVESASKDGYDHFLLKEIMEQPSAVSDTIRGRIVDESADIKFGGLIDVEEQLKKINRVILLGVGTSYYSAKLGELYFNAISGIPTTSAMSPEFRYNKNLIDEKTWVIAMSQSGETADTIAAIKEAKKHGALVTGIVNVIGSTISRETVAGVYNHIGPEISVASTKAITSQALLLLMHAILLGRHNDLEFSERAEIIKAIRRLPGAISELLEDRKQIEKIANSLYKSQSLLYMGRKFNYPIALEGALKIKEISYIHAEGLSGGELKHGFIALIDEKLPTVAIATNDNMTDKMISNIAEIKARKGPVIEVVNQPSGLADETILVPDINNDMLQPLVNNVSLQLLAYFVAKLKKVNIDQPRNLAKSVTVE
jgi:glucosamine--fructose-6-phosphate aminotransferase (isomerizing)